MIDALRFAVALAPLGLYLLVLGMLRLRSKPTVLSGAMDIVLLGMGLSGMMIIGPLELFFPRAAYSILGNWVWLLLIGLYFFGLMLVALNLPPRIIVYGLDENALRCELQKILESNSIEHQWLEDVLVLPSLGMRVHVEAASSFDVSHIVSIGRSQNIAGWFAMERLLVNEMHRAPQITRTQGGFLIGAGLLLVLVTSILAYVDRLKLVQLFAHH